MIRILLRLLRRPKRPVIEQPPPVKPNVITGRVIGWARVSDLDFDAIADDLISDLENALMNGLSDRDWQLLRARQRRLYEEYEVLKAEMEADSYERRREIELVNFENLPILWKRGDDE
jgi:hypothetical protein